MNYIGSKKSLLEFLDKSIASVVSNQDYVFSDLFAGTGIVGRYFKERGHKVIANDLQYYSYVLNRNYIGNTSELWFASLTDEVEGIQGEESQRVNAVLTHLMQIPSKPGFIYQNYAIGGTQGQEYERQYFSDENALCCDTIRQKIQERYDDQKITDDEYYFLLASLIESIDKVANTASVYGAFLKALKKSALKEMVLEPAYYTKSDKTHDTYNQNINTLIGETTHEVCYLDPPYNARQYSGNYHVLETIAKYDNPAIKGKTGMRDCTEQKSEYCSKRMVVESFTKLIQEIDAKYIFLSYNDEGLMTLDEIKTIMSSRGEYGVFEKKYKRFRADKAQSRNHKKDEVIEYLHYVKIH